MGIENHLDKILEMRSHDFPSSLYQPKMIDRTARTTIPTIARKIQPCFRCFKCNMRRLLLHGEDVDPALCIQRRPIRPSTVIMPAEIPFLSRDSLATAAKSLAKSLSPYSEVV